MREAIVCSALTSWLPMTIGSIVRLRHRRMAALALHRDGELGRRRHDRARPRRELADRQARHVVHAEHLFDGEALHHAVLDHLVAAAAAFLRRLEDDRDRAGEIARLGEIFGSAEQHGGVAVMAAGVHHAGRRRGVGRAGRLVDRQRIHVGAQADGRAGAQPAADDADHAGPADLGHHLVDSRIPSAWR